MRFLARVLDALDNIYRFESALKAPSGVEIALPIQTVHDVSRLTSRGSGRYWLIRATMVHAGAGSITTIVDPYAPASGTTVALNGWTTPGLQEEIWFIDAFGHLAGGAAANFNGGGVGINYPPRDVGLEYILNTATSTQLIRSWTSSTSYFGTFIPGGGLTHLPRPSFLPRGTTISILTAEGGGIGITTLTSLIIWRGAAGTTPPGVT